MTDFHSFMPETLRGLMKKLIGEFREASHGFPLGGGRTAAVDGHLKALWHLLRNGCAWRALPSASGPWCAIQFSNRLHGGLFRIPSGPHAHWGHIGGRVHGQHPLPGSPARQWPRRPGNKAIGRSCGGFNTKIHIVVDALGKLDAPMELMAGNVSDATVAPKLPENLQDTAVVGDKGQNSRPLRDKIRARDCEPCIPARKNVRDPEPYDAALYRTRHAVENVFEAPQGVPQAGQPL